MIVARPVTPESGKPPPKPLAVVMTSGTTPECSMENILPVRAMAALHLVGDHHDAVLIT